MIKLIDISPLISSQTVVWPGDPGFSRKVTLSLDEASVELSMIQTTLHIGAHADAPSHYQKGAIGMDQVDLTPYFGDCQVVEASWEKDFRIYPQNLKQKPVAPRILIKTGSFPDVTQFNEDFAALSPELIADLASKGCVLVGIDTPSIDPFSSQDLPSHKMLLQKRMANLEILDLQKVNPGFYQLSAFPLKIKDADGSPVRAVLIQESKDQN